MARLSGTVLKWTIRGFGFIKPEGSGDEELFCHFSEITDGRGLEEGSTIEFEIGYDEIKGKNRAVNVTGGIDEAPESGGKGKGKGRGRRRDGGGRGGGGGGGGDRACYNCGGLGHLSRDCSEPRTDGGGTRPKGICFDFQKGSCSRGDGCRFSHDLTAA